MGRWRQWQAARNLGKRSRLRFRRLKLRSLRLPRHRNLQRQSCNRSRRRSQPHVHPLKLPALRSRRHWNLQRQSRNRCDKRSRLRLKPWKFPLLKLPRRQSPRRRLPRSHSRSGKPSQRRVKLRPHKLPWRRNLQPESRNRFDKLAWRGEHARNFINEINTINENDEINKRHEIKTRNRSDKMRVPQSIRLWPSERPLFGDEH